jgi:O-antigen ligase
VGFCTGGVLLCQILWVYLTGDVVVDGVIQRNSIYTGWGMYNNMGLMLAMMIPYAFCLATKYRRGWIGTVAGSAYWVCVLLTCSRSSILGATLIYGVCVFFMLYYARNRRHNTIALISVTIAVLLALLLFHDQLIRLFSDLLHRGLDPNHRDEIFYEGWKLFAQKPIFGNSFFSPGYKPWAWSTIEGFNTFFPPRWHNTIVQLAASCGIVGLGAYILHRVQTFRLFLLHRTKENSFIACSILVLLGCGLFDCHFFNIGPVLFYSMALAFAENHPESKGA